ncbi:MAG: hypothetical protein AAF840_11260 [Bacteroidota bacterium]
MMTAVKPALEQKDLRKKSFRTKDIIELVQEVIKTDVDDTEVLAQQFTPDLAGLRSLFYFVDRSFSYKEDPAGSQWVQTPSYLWKTRVGDCKSYTVFISSVLQNMGVKHLIRYTAYGGSQYRHVYPVALLAGKEIPLDVVWQKQEGGRFGREKSYTKKKDFRMEKGLYKLGNSNTAFDERAIIGQMQSNLAEIEAAAASIPNVINEGAGDVTQMTKGEVERLIWADRYRVLAGVTEHGGKAGQYADAALALEQGTIAGIGSLSNDPFGRQVESILAKTAQMTRPAFAPFSISIPNPVPPHLSGLFKKIGKFIKKVANTVKNAFKKLVNFVFKGAGKAMGPFFLFQFLRKDKVRSPRIKNRIKAQEKSYNFIRRIGKFDDKQLKGLMLNGIIEKTRKTPAQLAKEGGAPQVAGLSAVVPVIVKAIKVVFGVISKIAGIFKRNKNEAGRVDESTMSDPMLFEEEARLHAASSAPGGGGGFSPILLASLAIPFVL